MCREIIEKQIHDVIDDVIEEKATRFYSKIMLRAAMIEYAIQKQSFKNNLPITP